MSGPFETSRDAFDAARVLRQAVAAADPDNGPMDRAARSRARVQYVRGILEVCGVQCGAYDKRIAAWVAGWDVETIQTITGWIERAHAAGQDAVRAEIADQGARTAPLESAAYVHALPPINFVQAVLRRAEPGPRCGAQDGRTALFMADVTCPACLELVNATAGEPVACGRCRVVFDPADTAFDGRARYGDTLFCRGCVDQCHEADAGHRCIICTAGGAR